MGKKSKRVAVISAAEIHQREKHHARLRDSRTAEQLQQDIAALRYLLQQHEERLAQAERTEFWTKLLVAAWTVAVTVLNLAISYWAAIK